MFEPRQAPAYGALWAHIATGVFIGTIAAAFVSWRVFIWTVETRAEEAAAAMRKSADQMQQARISAARQASAADATRRQLATDQQRADEARRREDTAEQERRDIAWARFYRKPAACDESRGGSWTVDCANDYIRAKARFADLYNAGKL